MALSMQKTFSISKNHLLKQKRKALDLTEGVCKYFNEEGLKCAIGVFIPDGHPGQKMEGDLSSLFSLYPDLKTLFSEKVLNSGMLLVLQEIHDSYPVKVWEKELKKAARKYKLKFTKEVRS